MVYRSIYTWIKLFFFKQKDDDIQDNDSFEGGREVGLEKNTEF